MTALEEALSRILEGLPPGSAVSLPVDWLRAQLRAVEEPLLQVDPVADLTVKELADELGRSVSTVRTWLSAGLIPRAYKLRDREWRVPRAGVREFLDHQACGTRPRAVSSERGRQVDLGSWRKVRLRGEG